ncbi:MarR family winged helix-turn-helix transcriptional regulator [Desulfoluna spongiiphila]|nr:MarR family winged helix-turn-helix transcriptional regulator [Desulfoluna spongiiphila]
MRNDPSMLISLISRIRDKANRFITAELSQHGIKGLAPVHGDLLVALLIHSELTMKEIADILDRKKSTVTTLVDKLITLGYASKRQDEMDGRSWRIFLTPAGKALQGDLIDISEKLMEKIYRGVPEADRREVTRILNGINTHWEP